MLTLDGIKSSWADEVELGDLDLPPTSEVRHKDYKTITEYKYNEDDKKVKIVRTYKIEKRFVSRSVALRKTLPKFGESANDKPGPNPATTIVAEDVFMQYISSKEEDNKPEEEGIDKLKAFGDKSVVKCRHCLGEHWTSKCPWKDTVLAGGKIPDAEKKPTTTANAPPEAVKPAGGSRYVPPSLRGDGAGKRVDSSNMSMRRDDTCAIRISNLSESTTDTDLEDLVKPFGPVQKLFLAKDKIHNFCKGFAYVHFKFRADAAKAIGTLNGYGYDHLILNVEWSKQPAHTNQQQ